jgi:hypothetical protein
MLYGKDPTCRPVSFTFGQLSSVFAIPQSNKPQPQLTAEQWQQDLQFLAKELPRRHKNAFHTVSRDQFEKSVADLNARIPSLQSHEIVIGLIAIVASVSDAHTQLSGFGDRFHPFPLNVYWFGSELRVTRMRHHTNAPLERAWCALAYRRERSRGQTRSANPT